MNDYSELLKDPRWQKKRLEILERDKFQCRACEDITTTLHIHHLFCDYKLKPWEYNNKELLTLCKNCHGILYLLHKNNIDIYQLGAIADCITKQEFINIKSG